VAAERKRGVVRQGKSGRSGQVGFGKRHYGSGDASDEGREGRAGLGFRAGWTSVKAAALNSIGADVKDDGSARGRWGRELSWFVSSRSRRGWWSRGRGCVWRNGLGGDRLSGLLRVGVDVGSVLEELVDVLFLRGRRQ